MAAAPSKAVTLLQNLGQLYLTVPAGFDSLLLRDPVDGSWRQPDPTEDLFATTYVYQPPPATFFQLAKYSLREDKSLTETIGAAKTMRENVLKRDGRCWVTKSTLKQTTTDSALEMQWLVGSCTTFAGSQSNSRSGWHHSLRDPPLLLVGDRSVEHQWFKHPPPQTPLLHGHRIRPPTPQGGFANPPDGLFRWHYLPCVLKLFGTTEYKELEHIAYPEKQVAHRKMTMMPIGLRQCGIGVGRWPDLKPSTNRDNVCKETKSYVSPPTSKTTLLLILHQKLWQIIMTLPSKFFLYAILPLWNVSGYTAAQPPSTSSPFKKAVDLRRLSSG
ncbi:hypothetical protein B0H14DRAFT_2611577 [Mycena olivaceomarginata]|nr:hypothetical protein B0H14DRAFT_2611577 [Mycena olivaceomarginata]